MRPWLHLLQLLVAALGFALPADSTCVAFERGGDAVVSDESSGWRNDSGGFRPHQRAFGSGTAIEVAPDAGRTRDGSRELECGPPASPPREHSPRCAPPRLLAEVGPFTPGESPFGQRFLRVNGSANANGSRA